MKLPRRSVPKRIICTLRYDIKKDIVARLKGCVLCEKILVFMYAVNGE